ncbi:MAG: long-chain fatty acid--CoA ligase [Pseudomonadota bacterium]
MLGQMMQRPLLTTELLRYGAELHGDDLVISAAVEGGVHQQTYRDHAHRAAQLGQALRRLGIGIGDRVATLAWNGYRHLELYYGVPGIGAICHTLNPRLSAEQMIYITNHAEDRLMFLDLTFVPIIEKLAPQFPADMRYVLMTDAANMPESSIDFLCYEDLLAAEDGALDWPEFDENTAAGLCYTSGTTGNPKGSLYSHRSQVLHAFSACVNLQNALRKGRRLMPVVPLFHANAWGTAHAPLLTGTSLVMPGPRLDGASVFDLLESAEVFSAFGVPTVWLGLLAEVEKRGRAPKGFGEIVVGGSAAAASLIRSFEEWGVNVVHAWGMTEMSPLGTVGALTPAEQERSFDERIALKVYQGRRAFGVDLKIVDEQGAAQPHDGKALGELFVRGNTVVSGYYNNAEASAAAMDEEGWFGTGDVAAITPEGHLVISDRTKDLIKSGGEWISSIDVENMAIGLDEIANCAVIAVPDEKWGERPILIAVPSCDPAPDPQSILDHLATRLAKWQVPDRVVFVEDLPLTATGKVSKLTLRQRFAE